MSVKIRRHRLWIDIAPVSGSVLIEGKIACAKHKYLLKDPEEIVDPRFLKDRLGWKGCCELWRATPYEEATS